MKKRFLLCVGCQKGGTTWLAEYLAATPGVRLGFQKEMHVLDTHFFAPHWLETRSRNLRAALTQLSPDPSEKRDRLTRQLAATELSQNLVGDLDAYARYFRGLAEGAEVVADLTPNYALLTTAHWTETRDALERHGFQPRIVFLMRDPERRMESAWRMHERNAPDRKRPPKGGLRGLLQRFAVSQKAKAPYLAFAGGENLERSRYETTIRALETVFRPEDIHYEFYELLFRPEAVAAINAFLGLPDRPANFDIRVNTSPVRTVIAPGERARVRALLAPTYRFCAERFGEARIRDLWQTI